MLSVEMRRNCLPQPPKTKYMSSTAISSTFMETNASVSSSPGKIVSVGSGHLQNGSDMMWLLNLLDDANRNLMNEIKEIFVSNKIQITVENRSEEEKLRTVWAPHQFMSLVLPSWHFFRYPDKNSFLEVFHLWAFAHFSHINFTFSRHLLDSSCQDFLSYFII